MTIEVDFWQLVSLAFGLIGAFAAFAKLFFAQVDKRLDARFAESEAAQAELRVWLKQHADDEAGRMRRLDADVRGTMDRLARVEAEIKHVPTHDDLKAIHARLDEFIPAIGRIQGIERLLHGINDYLRESGK
jgi:hypothetical protein